MAKDTIENREDKDSEKSLSKTYESLNNTSSSIVDEKKILINYLITNYLKKEPIPIPLLLSKLTDLVNDLEKSKKVLENEVKATVVLFCLENELIYLNGLKKLYPDKNINSLNFLLASLVKDRILEETPKTEFLKQKHVFSSFIIRNSKAGFYQAKKVRYYTLTDTSRGLFSNYTDDLKNISKHTKYIDNFKQQLLKTHKELELKARQGQEYLKKALTELKNVRSGPYSSMSSTKEYEHILKYWAENILPEYNIYLTVDELQDKVDGK